jgi:outer membrane protein assembly factor BamD
MAKAGAWRAGARGCERAGERRFGASLQQGWTAILGGTARRAGPTLLRAAFGFGALGCKGGPGATELGEVPSAEQLYQEAKTILASGHKLFWLVDTTKYDDAINRLQDIIDNYPYSDYAVLANLEIADTFFRRERWEEALTYYRDFAELHPDHPKVPFALYRAGLCHYRQSRDPGRDQTATKQAIAQLDELMRRFPDAPESREAEVLWRELRTRLGTHVMSIGDFYFHHDEFQSAADRYRLVLNEYPGLGLDPEALYKLGVCYERMKLTDEASRIFQVILDNYGGTEVAEAAAQYLPSEQVPAGN